jgi:hypothetical protein
MAVDGELDDSAAAVRLAGMARDARHRRPAPEGALLAGSWFGPSISLWAPMANGTEWPRASARNTYQMLPLTEAQFEAPASFVSSYRSAGGHAVASRA